MLFFIFGIGYFQLGSGDAQYHEPYGDPVAYQAYRSSETTFDFEKPSM